MSKKAEEIHDGPPATVAAREGVATGDEQVAAKKAKAAAKKPAVAGK